MKQKGGLWDSRFDTVWAGRFVYSLCTDGSAWGPTSHFSCAINHSVVEKICTGICLSSAIETHFVNPLPL